MGLDLVSTCKAADQLAAERGLAGSDITDDDIQTPAQKKREFQFLQTLQMLPGMKEKIRIG